MGDGRGATYWGSSLVFLIFHRGKARVFSAVSCLSVECLLAHGDGGNVGFKELEIVLPHPPYGTVTNGKAG
jgi:hypothetical protein